MSNIAAIIEQRTGYPNLLNDLQEKLSASELNTLLLELYRKKTQHLSPAELLKQFSTNKYAAPVALPTIAFKEYELDCLRLMEANGFNAITLSPLTSLGTCSAVAYVDQNNVASAVRGTEVVADATNVFALLIAQQYKAGKTKDIIKYATAHRHVRCQSFNNPGFTPHFAVLCLATGGMDTGSYDFELTHLQEHLKAHWQLLSTQLPNGKFILKCLLKTENEAFKQQLETLLQDWQQQVEIIIEQQPNAGDYYQLVQFKFFLQYNGQELNISDGGFVNWTQQLIPNKKHRLLISGIGTEFMYKIKNGMI
jgi:hypothetical protein